MIDFAPLIEPVAAILLGEPNHRLSGNGEMRYGTRGSLSVDVRTGRWYDHERGCGGGVLDLIEDRTGRKGGERIEWLVEQGIEIGSARTAPPPPKKGKPKLGCPL